MSLQVPLLDRVVLRPRPYLRPLLTAWSTAGPAGAVSVCAEEVRAVDLRFGLAENVAVFPYLGSIEQPELKGPATTVPGMAQHSAKQRDLYERREEEKLIRFLRSVAPRLVDLAKEREWGFLVVTGQAELAYAMSEALPVTQRTTGAHAGTPGQPPAAGPGRRGRGAGAGRGPAAPPPGAGRAGPRRRLQRRQRRVRTGRDAGRAAAGAGGPPAAAADGQWRGRATPNGVLAPDGEVPPGADPRSCCPSRTLASG